MGKGIVMGLNTDKLTRDLVQIFCGSDSADKNPDIEQENKNRKLAKIIGSYAEDGATFDPDGKYLCGSCSQRLEPNSCATVQGTISMTQGGCELYTIGEPEWQKFPEQFTQLEALYTERPEAKAFGCSRCKFGKQSNGSDTPIWCSFWQCHVAENGCCKKNTGKDDILAPGGKEE